MRRLTQHGQATLQQPGRANVVLVLGQEEDASAVISQLCATADPDVPPGSLEVTGPCSVDGQTLAHFREVVVPLLARSASALELALPGFRIALTNVGAASQQDRPLGLKGFSADLPFLLACLSAWLGMPVLADVLSTGHIADAHGAVRMVGQLPAKLCAAHQHEAIRAVLYPDPAADDSVDHLLPDASASIANALRIASEDLDLIPLRYVDDAIRAAFAEEEVVCAALRQGYFERETRLTEVADAMPSLSCDLTSRFWNCITKSLQTGQNGDGLLQARAAYARTRKAYPVGFGGRLRSVLAALPPAIHNLRVRFPLLPLEESASLANLAEARDIPDLRRLLDAIHGDGFSTLEVSIPGSQHDQASTCRAAAQDQLRVLLASVGPEEMSRQVRNPVDEAHATFTLASITAVSVQDCQDTVTALYRQMCSYIGIDHPEAAPHALAPEAFGLLDRAFARRGGAKAAYAEALHGTHGRLREVCFLLADQFKLEQEELRIEWTFRRALDCLDYDGRCALVGAFFEMVRPYLPQEEEASPPERFVDGLRPLVRAYVRSMESVKETLRAT